jgi:uncharacterized protein (TIGR02271 family)
MTQQQPVVVVSRDGVRGSIIGAAPPNERTGEPQILVRLEDGQQLVMDANVLLRRDDGTYALNADIGTGERVVVPVIREELLVGKRERTSTVRVRTVVHEREEQVDEPLRRETVEVERVLINRVVDEPVEARTEGDTVIIPVLEEQLVVEKRLVLKEELRITLRRSEERARQSITLRSEEAIVERDEETLRSAEEN